MHDNMKTEAYKKSEGSKSDVRIGDTVTTDDFAVPRSLHQVRQSLQTYADEIANMIEWVKAEFGSPLHEPACKKLDAAKRVLERLIKLAEK